MIEQGGKINNKIIVMTSTGFVEDIRVRREFSGACSVIINWIFMARLRDQFSLGRDPTDISTISQAGLSLIGNGLSNIKTKGKWSLKVIINIEVF